MNLIEERKVRTQWFMDARFGMFIHFGLYAIPARGEWVKGIEKMSDGEYRKYFDEFNPDRCDMREWARLARQAGMKYAVLTAKHHDGFCLFDSGLTDFKSTNTKAGRDFIREYVEAFRAEGLKVGIYYSIIDWHHEDYPHFGDKHHPMRDNEAFRGKTHDFDRYLVYMHGQVRELCTQYGKIDIMWFDFSYDGMTGEKWRATQLVEMVRSLQPGIVIDNRLDAGGDSTGSIKSSNPCVYSGDFASPEQVIPSRGVVDDTGTPVPWEACATMNNHWGYCSTDKNFKSPKLIVRKLVECASKNGNLLLNVGPDARGQFPEESVEILEAIGDWTAKNGKGIYGCGMARFPKPEWGYFTQNGNLLYAHIFDGNIGQLCLLPGMAGSVKKMRLLSDGTALESLKEWNTYEYPDDLFVNFGETGYFTYPLPDGIDTVVEIELV